eukprot:5062979-Pyramimonas_sp.AAC.1
MPRTLTYYYYYYYYYHRRLEPTLAHAARRGMCSPRRRSHHPTVAVRSRPAAPPPGCGPRGPHWGPLRTSAQWPPVPAASALAASSWTS